MDTPEDLTEHTRQLLGAMMGLHNNFLNGNEKGMIHPPYEKGNPYFDQAQKIIDAHDNDTPLSELGGVYEVVSSIAAVTYVLHETLKLACSHPSGMISGYEEGFPLYDSAEETLEVYREALDGFDIGSEIVAVH